MSDTECQLRELQTALAAKDAMILAIADRLAICSALLSRWAERPEFRRPARHKDVKTTLDYYTDESMADLGAIADKL